MIRVQSLFRVVILTISRRTSLLALAAGLALGVMSPPAGAQAPSPVNSWGTQGSGPGQFQFAHGIAAGPDGAIYVGDTVNNRIQKFAANGDFLAQWPASFPSGLAVDLNGNVFVAGDDVIQKFTTAGSLVTSWGSTGTGPGQFQFPVDVAVNAGGDVYVVDWMNHRIQKFTGDGGFLTAWGSEGTGDGQFMAPISIDVSPDGGVHVADIQLDRVQSFGPAGEFGGAWASSGSGLGQLRSPTGIAIDPAGYILVLDAGNGRVDVFSLGGLGALFNFGTEGHDVGQFFHPAAIAVDPDGRILVMDKDNHRVQVFASISSPVMPVTWSRIKTFIDP